ncbi:MAG: hypothetical protein JNN07_21955 [Verrucomicrobiales bacterium]|nr:hypothetical protein [Verrucomicrobiales bacterium]
MSIHYSRCRYDFAELSVPVILASDLTFRTDSEEDRPTSFIVRFTPNSVLQRLYAAVGIETICIDPDGTAQSPQEKSALLGDFLHRLATAASPDGLIPGSSSPLFLSSAFSATVRRILEPAKTRTGSLRSYGYPNAALDRYLVDAAKRIVPMALKPEVAAALRASLTDVLLTTGAIQLALSLTRQCKGSPECTEVIVMGFRSNSGGRLIMDAKPDWAQIWGYKIRESVAQNLVTIAERELNSHKQNQIDTDLAFLMDILKRITNDQLCDLAPESTLKKSAQAVLAEASEFYPSVRELQPDPNGPPTVEDLVEEIEQAIASKPSPEPPDDVPF